MTKIEAQGELPAALGAPALRALIGAGFTRLKQFENASEDEVLRLHGMGPKALRVMRRALAAKGLRFRKPSNKK